VTLPGDTMRSRHSHGMVRMLGLERDLSARDADDYVAIATRLVRDPTFHSRMGGAIEAGRARLFDDPAPVPELAAFLWRACGRA
jgi:predicted O-linked N-acetylglucosamine transferase (SPINDLY family)